MAQNPGQDDSSGRKPITVSSTSSMETLHNDAGNYVGSSNNLSADPSLIRSIPNANHSVGTSNYAKAMPSSISLVGNRLRSPSTGVVIPSVSSPNAVPEFLYQLTKMLTDNNRDIIEWSNGKIEVHNPHKLQTLVLNRYFRHSKFASFQRQLNYFGFRKLAGKGKMAPCSYVNDATTNELRSLLHIKRKTGNEPKSKTVDRRRTTNASGAPEGHSLRIDSGADPSLSANFHASGSSANAGDNRATQPQHSQQALARVAVGKGIRHGFSLPRKDSSASASASTLSRTPESGAVNTPTPEEAGLSALQHNFKNSFHQDNDFSERSLSQDHQPALNNGHPSTSSLTYVPGSLRRDDSLVDLAMIPLTEGDSEDQMSSSGGLSFIDFPWDPSFNDSAKNDIP